MIRKCGECNGQGVVHLPAKFDSPEIADLFRQTSATFGVTTSAIMGKGRHPNTVAARHFVVRHLRDSEGWTNKELGTLFSMDHSSIIYILNGRRDRMRR